MLAAQSDEHTKTPSTSRATLYQSAVGLVEVSEEEVRFGAPKSNLLLPASNAGVAVRKVLGPDLQDALKLVAQLAEANRSNDELPVGGHRAQAKPCSQKARSSCF
jgi:hypothetical protein